MRPKGGAGSVEWFVSHVADLIAKSSRSSRWRLGAISQSEFTISSLAHPSLKDQRRQGDKYQSQVPEHARFSRVTQVHAHPVVEPHLPPAGNLPGAGDAGRDVQPPALPRLAGQ